jgi:Uri superfamily endonuclease
MIVATIPKTPGTYTLIITVTQPFRKKIGKLGYHTFPTGSYTYTGSAIGIKSSNLNSRIRHHLNPRKKQHWHIDRLLSSDNTKIAGVIFLETERKLECILTQKLAEINGANKIVNGFGASDCHTGCKAHLHQFNIPQEELIPKIIEQYEICGIPKIFKKGKLQITREQRPTSKILT